MRTHLSIALSVIACLACGPPPPAEEPAAEPGPADEEPEEGSAAVGEEVEAPVEVEVAEEPEEATPQPAGSGQVEGSASGTEVKPMSVKDFDVSTEVDFDPSPAKEKKASTIEKIGMATAGTTDCYLELLTQQPELEGTIEIAFKITPAGGAKAVKAASNTTGSEKLEKCAIKAFKSKKYPKKLAGKQSVQAVVTISLKPYK
jgi:hypothetical protein